MPTWSGGYVQTRWQVCLRVCSRTLRQCGYCEYPYIYIHTHTYMHTNIHNCLVVCMYVCMYVTLCVCFTVCIAAQVMHEYIIYNCAFARDSSDTWGTTRSRLCLRTCSTTSNHWRRCELQLVADLWLDLYICYVWMMCMCMCMCVWAWRQVTDNAASYSWWLIYICFMCEWCVCVCVHVCVRERVSGIICMCM